MHEKFVEEFVTQFPEGGASVIPQVRKIMMSRVRQITPLSPHSPVAVHPKLLPQWTLNLGFLLFIPNQLPEERQARLLFRQRWGKCFFSKPNQFWLHEKLNEKHLDSFSHALSRSPQTFRTPYTPMVLNAPLLPTRRIYEERNSENTPV